MEKNKKGFYEIDGTVVETLPSSKFLIQLEDDRQIMAYTCGKMRRYNIKVLLGDSVRIELSEYDLNNGRIVHRYNKNKK